MTGLFYFHSVLLHYIQNSFYGFCHPLEGGHVIVQFIYKKELFCVLLPVFGPCLSHLDFVQLICKIYRLLFNMGILTEITLF